MTLREELRTLDIANPGQWSARASLMLAGALFLLISCLGLQLWVRGQVLPPLANATERLPLLNQRLDTARRDARRAQAVQFEAQRLAQDLRQTQVWIPPGSEDLNLTVSLTGAQSGALVKTVRPWQPAGDFARQLAYAGAEVQVEGAYREILNFLAFALASQQLRELVELTIEPAGEESGKLLATARMLAYFGGDIPSESLPAPSAKANAFPPPAEEIENLPSPFGFALDPGEAGPVAEPEPGDALVRRGGRIQVGREHYELVEDSSGNMRLQRGGS